MLKKIMNLHEEVTHSRLRSVCENYGALVYPKIRLADVFSIEGSGISRGNYRFALQSHFDFLVTDDKHQPMFAIEFDGFSHRDEAQKRRDAIKNRLCDKFELPLLRINSNYLLKKYRNMDLLSWFVEVWFLAEGFYEAQESGQIPYDEPFDPFNLSISDRDEMFPLDLTVDVLLEIERLHEEGRCKDHRPSHFVGTDEKGNYHGIAYLRMDNNAGVFAETAMRNQNFPGGKMSLAGDLEPMLSDLLADIVIHELYEKLLEVLENKSQALPLSYIHDEFKFFTASIKFMWASTIEGGNLVNNNSAFSL